jgi:ABC-type multidrug transport system fused ATPase/permease subunit
MIRDAPILILDEPTTGLDVISGERILEPLGRLMDGRTTIIVTHNLSTAREADQILVIDGGRIVEAGTHGGLLAKENGPYADLWRRHDASAPAMIANGAGAVVGTADS